MLRAWALDSEPTGFLSNCYTFSIKEVEQIGIPWAPSMLNGKQQRLLAEMNVNHSVLRPIVILNFLVCYFIYNSAIILLTFCLDERPSNGVSWRLNDFLRGGL